MTSRERDAPVVTMHVRSANVLRENTESRRSLDSSEKNRISPLPQSFTWGEFASIGVAALPRLGPGGRALILTAIPLVGLSRVYVGAHFPLDIAGGAALGLAVNAAAGTAVRRYSTRHRG